MRTTEQRFREKVAPANTNGCELWTACADRKGYGRFGAGDRMALAHRYAWTLAKGPIPDGLCVLHRCDTPACVNPWHLFLGTHAVNMADMVAKGRSADRRGNKNAAKLNEATAVEIFHAAGSQRAIAARQGVSQTRVGLIKRRKIWAHATSNLTNNQQRK